MKRQGFVTTLQREWWTDSRWEGITRPYTAGDVSRLRGSIDIEYTLARLGAARLWELLQEEAFVPALSAVTGNQALQLVQAGLRAIYVSGWQVAADANNALQMYPDQSLYPSDSVPTLLRRINNALKRADEIHHLKGDHAIYWFAPLVADAEAGLGGPPHAFQITKKMTAEGPGGGSSRNPPAPGERWGRPGGPRTRVAGEAVHAKFPRKLLAYNCSPSFNWKKPLTKAQIASFQKELGGMGYKFQFVTLSAFHALNHSLWLLAKAFKDRGMAAYADLQEHEFTSERDGYEAIRHQEFVGVAYFDEVTQVATNGKSATLAMEGSTEQEQFRGA